MNSIPLADAPALAPAARRTLLVRGVLVSARGRRARCGDRWPSRNPHSQTIVALPNHADTIVVLDLSASIGSDTYSRIGATLSSLARSRDRYGLVVFSGPGVRGAAAGLTRGGSHAARPLLRSAAGRPGLRADLSAQPVVGHVQRGNGDLERPRARPHDRHERRRASPARSCSSATSTTIPAT